MKVGLLFTEDVKNVIIKIGMETNQKEKFLSNLLKIRLC